MTTSVLRSQARNVPGHRAVHETEMVDSPLNSTIDRLDGNDNEWPGMGPLINERSMTEQSETYSFATNRSERIFEELANGE